MLDFTTVKNMTLKDIKAIITFFKEEKYDNSLFLEMIQNNRDNLYFFVQYEKMLFKNINDFQKTLNYNIHFLMNFFQHLEEEYTERDAQILGLYLIPLNEDLTTLENMFIFFDITENANPSNELIWYVNYKNALNLMRMYLALIDKKEDFIYEHMVKLLGWLEENESTFNVLREKYIELENIN